METQEWQWFTFVLFLLFVPLHPSLFCRRVGSEKRQLAGGKFKSCTNLMMVELLSLCLPKPFYM